ncbi:hypothetical protein L249_4769 [Ophiocordyceps polyrhachis-furcata BCC 54312]|uniref:Uncharacterized protein n=1 Tax=Ophiocordyceps polyrhachis-furcata BCC 54312 TaxID=1330021 RepID=A0A367L2R8_9HYPO|nr:hypothetical protein L249_4769 [Ophiocordyceps polyrhachis-furcata BCC 54312]
MTRLHHHSPQRPKGGAKARPRKLPGSRVRTPIEHISLSIHHFNINPTPYPHNMPFPSVDKNQFSEPPLPTLPRLVRRASRIPTHTPINLSGPPPPPPDLNEYRSSEFHYTRREPGSFQFIFLFAGSTFPILLFKHYTPDIMNQKGLQATRYQGGGGIIRQPPITR